MTFLGKIVPYLVYLGQGKDFKLTTELSWKSAICPQPGNKNDDADDDDDDEEEEEEEEEEE